MKFSILANKYLSMFPDPTHAINKLYYEGQKDNQQRITEKGRTPKKKRGHLHLRKKYQNGFFVFPRRPKPNGIIGTIIMVHMRVKPIMVIHGHEWLCWKGGGMVGNKVGGGVAGFRVDVHDKMIV